MTEHKSALFVLISVVIIYWQVLCADGLVWKDAPDEVLNVQQGSNITLRWHYEMEANETFHSSDLVSNDRKSKVYYLLASRYKGKSHYNYLSDKKQTKFAISGKNNVTLNLFSAEIGYSNSVYCCTVYWNSNETTMREERCTTIYIYEYKPENTTLVHWVSNNTLYIKCTAIASPPPNYFLIRINEEQYNSTNVINTFRYISTNNNTVSCIPFNKYGQGPMKEINLPVYVMTQRNSTSDSNKEIITKEKKLPLIIGISCGIPIAICCLTVAVLIYWRKRNGITLRDKKPTDEDPYAAPLDTVVPSAEVLLPKSGSLLGAGSMKGKRDRKRSRKGAKMRFNTR